MPLRGVQAVRRKKDCQLEVIMKYVSQPIRIAGVTAKNRIVMPPMATYMAGENGEVSQENLDYYAARARGGHIGIITTEHFFITQQGKARERQISIASDTMTDGLKKLTACLHQSGSLAVAQLNHAGTAALREVTGMDPAGPSAIRPAGSQEDAEGGRAMTADEIHALPGLFAAAAGRAEKAGYDGVEIHAAHGYLLDQFYSPLTNKRTDEYGGELMNRIRIIREVIRAVREKTGPSYMVGLRLGGCDYMEGGATIEDAVNACRVLEKDGLDYLSLTGGMCRYMRRGMNFPGYFGDLSEAVRKKVSVPVLLTGGVKDIADADRLIGEGKADLIGVGRALLKDPEWADRAFA